MNPLTARDGRLESCPFLAQLHLIGSPALLHVLGLAEGYMEGTVTLLCFALSLIRRLGLEPVT